MGLRATPRDPCEAEEFAEWWVCRLSGGCVGWLGQRINKGEDAQSALPGASGRHSCGRRSRSAQLGTESGLEFPEGCLAELPLLFRLFPLLLLRF